MTVVAPCRAVSCRPFPGPRLWCVLAVTNTRKQICVSQTLPLPTRVCHMQALPRAAALQRPSAMTNTQIAIRKCHATEFTMCAHWLPQALHRAAALQQPAVRDQNPICFINVLCH